MKTRRLLGAVLAAALLPTPSLEAQLTLDWENGVLGYGVRCIVDGPAGKFILLPSPNPGPTPLNQFYPGDPRVLNVGINQGFWKFGVLDGTNPTFIDYNFPPEPAFVGLVFYGQACSFPGPTYFVNEISNPISFGLQLEGGNHPTVGEQVEPRSRHTATALLDGKVLIAGGLRHSLAFPGVTFLSQTLELFDPLTQTFEAGPAPLVQGRHSHTATRLRDGRVLLVGGADGAGDALPSAEIYEPNSRVTTPAPPMQFPRALHQGVLLDDGRVLVVGGTLKVGAEALGFPEAYDNGSAPFLEIYNPFTNQWSTGPPLSHTLVGHRLARLPNGKVLIAGGVEFFPTPLTVNRARLYDPATNQLTPTAPLPRALAFHQMTPTTSGLVLVAGGALVDVAAPKVTPSRATFIYTPDPDSPGGDAAGWNTGSSTGEEVIDGEVICVPSGAASGPDWVVEYIIVEGYESVDPSDDGPAVPNPFMLAIDENLQAWTNLGTVLATRAEGQLSVIDGGLRLLMSGVGVLPGGGLERRGEIHVRQP